uniref:Uncharacterized protein n=1 Tax=Arundo donax TaxID=35708 RepID=A0A0A9BC55_ARUDO
MRGTGCTIYRQGCPRVYRIKYPINRDPCLRLNHLPLNPWAPRPMRPAH